MISEKESPIYICQKLGSGFGSCVYFANYNGQQCAVKLIDKAWKHSMPKYTSIKQDLYAESSFLSGINHPYIIKNIVPCTAGFLINPFGIPFKAHYSVLELLEGGELYSYAKFTPLNEDEMRYYALQIVDALSYLHERGFAHRDIKGHNILINGSLDCAKLSDFGFALSGEKVLPEGIKGTHEYLSPEMLMGISYNLQKADIFALGVTFYSLVTGRFPCTKECTQNDPTYKLLCDKKYGEFWKKSGPAAIGLSAEFKELIQEMLKPSMLYRPTIKKVKESTWLTKPCLQREVIVNSMNERRNIIT